MIGMPGASAQQMSISRYVKSVDAEGTPNSNPQIVATNVFGYLHEYSGTEMRGVTAANGASIGGFAQLPYGTDLRARDILTTTFANGASRSFMVSAVRDNHIALRAEITRMTA